MKVDAVVFDLDHTVYDESKYFEAVFQSFTSMIGREELMEQFRDGYLQLRPYSKNIFSDILVRSGLSPEKNLQSLYEIYCSVDCLIQPFHDFLHFLDVLRAKQFRTGLLTNGSLDAQKNKIRNLGISSAFEAIVFARMFGRDFEKPHPKSFAYIRELLGNGRVAFIGDNPQTDFVGAKEAGGITFRLKRGLYNLVPSGEDVDCEFTSFTELVFES